MSCTTTCIQPSPSQAHCGACHVTFGGVSGFDRHRRDGQCLTPEAIGHADNGRGVFRAPMDERQRARLAALNPDAASALQATRGTAETGPGVPEVGVAISKPAKSISGGAA